DGNPIPVVAKFTSVSKNNGKVEKEIELVELDNYETASSKSRVVRKGEDFATECAWQVKDTSCQTTGMKVSVAVHGNPATTTAWQDACDKQTRERYKTFAVSLEDIPGVEARV